MSSICVRFVLTENVYLIQKLQITELLIIQHSFFKKLSIHKTKVIKVVSLIQKSGCLNFINGKIF